MICKALWIAASLAVASPAAAVTNKYVSASATGSGDGSQGSPWRLGEANSNAQPGYNIILAAGTYSAASNNQIAPARSGTGRHADSAIVYVGTTCVGAGQGFYRPTTDAFAWADCDSASGTVIVNGTSTINRSFIMLRGIRFGVLEFTKADASVRAISDSVSWCTITYELDGAKSTDLVVYRNLLRVSATNDSSGDAHYFVDFDNGDGGANQRGTGIVFRRNRVELSPLGSKTDTKTGDCIAAKGWLCEDRAMWFRAVDRVTLDSNRVSGSFRKHRPGYFPYETLVLYLANIPNLDSKDNRFDFTCNNRNRQVYGSDYAWQFGFVRDSCGFEWGAPLRKGSFGFKRDSIFMCLESDTVWATRQIGGSAGGKMNSFYMDSCVIATNTAPSPRNSADAGITGSRIATDRGTLRIVGDVIHTRLQGNLIVNRAGPALVIGGSVDKLEVINNTLVGRPGLWATTSAPAFQLYGGGLSMSAAEAVSVFRKNVIWNPATTRADNDSGALRAGRFTQWAVAPRFEENIYYSSDNDEAEVVEIEVSDGDERGRSGVGPPQAWPACSGPDDWPGCWALQGVRNYDITSVFGNPGFLTTSLYDSLPNWKGRGGMAFSGRVGEGSLAKAMGAGCCLPVPETRPATFTVSDSLATGSSITLVWAHPGQDGMADALADTTAYSFWISLIDPDSTGTEFENGYFDDDAEYLARGSYYAGDFANSVRNPGDWYRANGRSTVTMGDQTTGAPGKRTRATITYYQDVNDNWIPLGADRKYWIVVQARNSSNRYSLVNSYVCAFTDSSPPYNGCP